MNSSRLTLVLTITAILGLALWGSMLWLTKGDVKPNDLLIHLGETGATLAVLTVLGGLVRLAFKERDETQRKEEAKLDFYRTLLADFKTVYDRVERCRFLVEAHQSAKTYRDQMRGLVGGVVTLHNIRRALDPEFPDLKKELSLPIRAMTMFLKDLLYEFRDAYPDISKLQEADEAWNKYAWENLPKEKEGPEAYKPVSRAWTEIEKLSKLRVLRDDDQFEQYESNFLKYLDEASKALRRRLPVEE